MNAGRTARERARAELTEEIKNEARRQLRIEGPAALSLRAVARELGMVSSALYRYFRNRDELLTALITDAYRALGAAAEQAVATVPAEDHRDRWRACWHAARDWAVAHPHEYALIYGSPVPGYHAPGDTIAAARRLVLVLLGVLRDGHAAGRLRPLARVKLPGGLAGQLDALIAEFAPELSRELFARLLSAWTQLFGAISFELFGHYVGSVDPSADFFAYLIEDLADQVGLPA
ncbi:TetR family transcriptional regulator [Tamaricihabitans halophyticus]|uniref:TetR family transcriptional regulator n=1 Tax=Tamaricihabitans halophyticus TaxID=1262583 RepID=A0A4R2Q0E2_9PSEU|nr:TetR/AcrR family transcriptional regulator [Tamaricihabitans halophyticus]TCP41124.1 TetR family transcriptional regulator [Tamaricihabitans halophyticus]